MFITGVEDHFRALQANSRASVSKTIPHRMKAQNLLKAFWEKPFQSLELAATHAPWTQGTPMLLIYLKTTFFIFMFPLNTLPPLPAAYFMPNSHFQRQLFIYSHRYIVMEMKMFSLGSSIQSTSRRCTDLLRCIELEIASRKIEGDTQFAPFTSGTNLHEFAIFASLSTLARYKL